MEMPITIIRTIFQIGKRTTSWYPLTKLGGIQSIWPLQPSQNNLSLLLKKNNRSLIMFPSGSRHSQDVKGGVAIIAKMAKVRIMPVTYTGPRDLKGLATGERIDMNFGHPIDISDIKKMNDEGVAEVARRIQEEFDRLDAEAQAINTPTKPSILIRLLKILLIPLVLVVGILTLLFSYLASFVWDPDKHRKNK